VPKIFAVAMNIPILLYGIRADFRFNELIGESEEVLDAKFITNKITYYRNLNRQFIICMGFTLIPEVAQSIDLLTTNKLVNNNTFAADLLTTISNFAIVLDVITIGELHNRREEHNDLYCLHVT
jgi:hypothetical protein